MLKTTEPKKVLCIHDLSGFGRCSLSVILPVLSVMGVQPVALPTVLLSTHTGGFGQPARLDGAAYGQAALQHYHQLGISFDLIYTGYLGGEEQAALAQLAFSLWPQAHKVVDPVLGDGGHAYSTVTPAFIQRMRDLCRQADLILPNCTEVSLLLDKVVDPVLGDGGHAYSTVTPAFIQRMRDLCRQADLILPNCTEVSLLLDTPLPEGEITPDTAQALADKAASLAPNAVVTGLPMGSYIGCAGGGKDRFVLKKLHLDRNFPGTGDLYGAVLVGSLLQGNALSAAADNAAEFVSLAIQATPADQETRCGVWFEPLLPRLCPMQHREVLE